LLYGTFGSLKYSNSYSVIEYVLWYTYQHTPVVQFGIESVPTYPVMKSFILAPTFIIDDKSKFSDF
jgi:hypothetical protein